MYTVGVFEAWIDTWARLGNARRWLLLLHICVCMVGCVAAVRCGAVRCGRGYGCAFACAHVTPPRPPPYPSRSLRFSFCLVCFF